MRNVKRLCSLAFSAHRRACQYVTYTHENGAYTPYENETLGCPSEGIVPDLIFLRVFEKDHWQLITIVNIAIGSAYDEADYVVFHYTDSIDPTLDELVAQHVPDEYTEHKLEKPCCFAGSVEEEPESLTMEQNKVLMILANQIKQSNQPGLHDVSEANAKKYDDNFDEFNKANTIAHQARLEREAAQAVVAPLASENGFDTGALLPKAEAIAEVEAVGAQAVVKMDVVEQQEAITMSEYNLGLAIRLCENLELVRQFLRTIEHEELIPPESVVVKLKEYTDNAFALLKFLTEHNGMVGRVYTVNEILDHVNAFGRHPLYESISFFNDYLMAVIHTFESQNYVGENLQAFTARLSSHALSVFTALFPMQYEQEAIPDLVLKDEAPMFNESQIIVLGSVITRLDALYQCLIDTAVNEKLQQEIARLIQLLQKIYFIVKLDIQSVMPQLDESLAQVRSLSKQTSVSDRYDVLVECLEMLDRVASPLYPMRYDFKYHATELIKLLKSQTFDKKMLLQVLLRSLSAFEQKQSLLAVFHMQLEVAIYTPQHETLQTRFKQEVEQALAHLRMQLIPLPREDEQFNCEQELALAERVALSEEVKDVVLANERYRHSLVKRLVVIEQIIQCQVEVVHLSDYLQKIANGDQLMMHSRMYQNVMRSNEVLLRLLERLELLPENLASCVPDMNLDETILQLQTILGAQALCLADIIKHYFKVELAIYQDVRSALVYQGLIVVFLQSNRDSPYPLEQIQRMTLLHALSNRKIIRQELPGVSQVQFKTYEALRRVVSNIGHLCAIDSGYAVDPQLASVKDLLARVYATRSLTINTMIDWQEVIYREGIYVLCEAEKLVAGLCSSITSSMTGTAEMDSRTITEQGARKAVSAEGRRASQFANEIKVPLDLYAQYLYMLLLLSKLVNEFQFHQTPMTTQTPIEALIPWFIQHVIFPHFEAVFNCHYVDVSAALPNQSEQLDQQAMAQRLILFQEAQTRNTEQKATRANYYQFCLGSLMRVTSGAVVTLITSHQPTNYKQLINALAGIMSVLPLPDGYQQKTQQTPPEFSGLFKYASESELQRHVAQALESQHTR